MLPWQVHTESSNSNKDRFAFASESASHGDTLGISTGISFASVLSSICILQCDICTLGSEVILSKRASDIREDRNRPSLAASTLLVKAPERYCSCKIITQGDDLYSKCLRANLHTGHRDAACIAKHSTARQDSKECKAAPHATGLVPLEMTFVLLTHLS